MKKSPGENVVTIRLETGRQSEMVDITARVRDIVARRGSTGVCHVYTPHTTAGITINENADPDVAADMVAAFARLVPRNGPYAHAEGNSAAHILSTMVGCSQTVIVENGRLLLGTWQGIYFCEFDGPRRREVWVKITEG
jgi:secondary thiamine-phosphate synthase enzyme